MIRILSKSVAFYGFLGSVITHGRRDNARRPSVENLEDRMVLSTVLHNPAYDTAPYQPLNGAKTYSAVGTGLPSYYTNTYGFYAAKGNSIAITIGATGFALGTNFAYEIDAIVPSPTTSKTNLIYYVDDASKNSYKFAAPYSGIYTVQMRPSLISHVGMPSGYDIHITGASLPFIDTANPKGSPTDTFYITTDPKMPAVTAVLAGVAPDPLHLGSYTWAASIDYNALDFPEIPAVHGLKLDEHTVYPTQTIKTGANPYYLSYNVMFLDSSGKPLISGGSLLLSAQTVVAGVSIVATNDYTGADLVQILGINPSAATVKTYINGFKIPGNFPAKSGYDYHTILRQIAAQESSGKSIDMSIYHEFSDLEKNEGEPYFNNNGNSTSDGGDGIMQITPPKSLNDIWDWTTNVSDGVATFNTGLNVANNYLSNYERYGDTNLAADLLAAAKALGLSKVTMAALTPTRSGAD